MCLEGVRMRWDGRRQSDNVEDRRSVGGDDGMVAASVGRRMGGRRGGAGLGLGVIVIALAASVLLGVNPLSVLSILGAGVEAPVLTSTTPTPGVPLSHRSGVKPGDEPARFVSTVLADTEDVWKAVFAGAGATYRAPTLVLFRGVTATACGRGQSAMGPFYCPGDEKVYIDLSFYDTLRRQLGAPGDFAQAYVIAHEVGHHLQKLLGISGKVDAARSRMSEAQANAMSVRLELQADCFAGVWAHRAHRTKNILEAGDIEEAMNAAARIGDDALQRRSQGYAVPETFTHGSSRQRTTWFRRGLESGDLEKCNTFEAGAL